MCAYVHMPNTSCLAVGSMVVQRVGHQNCDKVGMLSDYFFLIVGLITLIAR